MPPAQCRYPDDVQDHERVSHHGHELQQVHVPGIQAQVEAKISAQVSTLLNKKVSNNATEYAYKILE